MHYLYLQTDHSSVVNTVCGTPDGDIVWSSLQLVISGQNLQLFGLHLIGEEILSTRTQRRIVPELKMNTRGSTVDTFFMKKTQL